MEKPESPCAAGISVDFFDALGVRFGFCFLWKGMGKAAFARGSGARRKIIHSDPTGKRRKVFHRAGQFYGKCREKRVFQQLWKAFFQKKFFLCCRDFRNHER